MYAKRVIKYWENAVLNHTFILICCYIFSDFLNHCAFGHSMVFPSLVQFLFRDSSPAIFCYQLYSFTIVNSIKGWPGLTQDPLEKHVQYVGSYTSRGNAFPVLQLSQIVAFNSIESMPHRESKNPSPWGYRPSSPWSYPLSQLDLRNPHLQLWGIPFVFSHSMSKSHNQVDFPF